MWESDHSKFNLKEVCFEFISPVVSSCFFVALLSKTTPREYHGGKPKVTNMLLGVLAFRNNNF